MKQTRVRPRVNGDDGYGKIHQNEYDCHRHCDVFQRPIRTVSRMVHIERPSVKLSATSSRWWSIATKFVAILGCLTIAVTEAESAGRGDDKKIQILPSDHPNKDDELLNWVLSKGGYWNTKQFIGIQDKSIGLTGVVAQDYIEEGEVLVQVPWDAVITPINLENAEHHRTNVDETLGGSKLHPYDRRFMNCDTAKRLHDEFLLFEQSPTSSSSQSSEYGPYLSSLKKTAKDHYNLLPAHWSKAGKNLLSTVLGTNSNITSSEINKTNNKKYLQPLPPDDMFLTDFLWKPTCENLTSKEAVLLVMTHGEDFGMVPITDKYNSRGGSYEGAYFETAGDTSNDIALEIRASRDIHPGEPITTSYYDDEAMGVPELLRDYGYIEPYPQKYIFHSQNIAFDVTEDVDEDEDEDELGEDETVERNHDLQNRGTMALPNLKVKWLESLSGVPGKRYMHPKQKTRPGQLYKAMSYLHRHYERLVAVYPKLGVPSTDLVSTIPDHEVQTTILFCSTMLAALHAALVDLDILSFDDFGHDMRSESTDEL